MSLLVLSNIAGLRVADLIDYNRGKQRLQELPEELQSMEQQANAILARGRLGRPLLNLS